jgi:hypothetical protein
MNAHAKRPDVTNCVFRNTNTTGVFLLPPVPAADGNDGMIRSYGHGLLGYDAVQFGR